MYYDIKEIQKQIQRPTRMARPNPPGEVRNTVSGWSRKDIIQISFWVLFMAGFASALLYFESRLMAQAAPALVILGLLLLFRIMDAPLINHIQNELDH